MEKTSFNLEKDGELIKNVSRYIYPFHGNTSYHNENYYNNLIKKYGKKTIVLAIKWETKYGNINHAFRG